MLIKHDCTAGGERKCSKQGFISLVFQAAVFSLSITGREREWKRGAGGEIVVEMRWEHKPGKIPVLLLHRLLSWGGLVSRPPGTCLSEGLSPTERRILRREPQCFCRPPAEAALSANSRRLSDHARVAALMLRIRMQLTEMRRSQHQGLRKATLSRYALDREGVALI